MGHTDLDPGAVSLSYIQPIAARAGVGIVSLSFSKFKRSYFICLRTQTSFFYFTFLLSFLSLLLLLAEKLRIIRPVIREKERSMNLQQERIDKITNYLYENETASVSELSKLLDVSLVTVRKDLTAMEKDGILSKTRGGAVLANKKNNRGPCVRIPPALERIADLAVEHIQPGDFIFLNSGMTCLALAERVKDIEGVSVITNNVSAVSVLKPKVQNIILLGGELEQTADGLITTVDSNVGNSLGNIFVNKAFSSGVGIDPDIGLTVNTMGSTYIYKYIPQLCSKWYVMMDAKKFNVKAFYQAASIQQISTLITDVTDEASLDRYREKGLQVLHP